jgi:DNA-binding protein H-NS
MQMNLKSMSIDALVALRGRIDTALSSKVAGERRALESQLASLTRVESGSLRKIAVGRGGARGKVAPKYHNPENPAETWAGRGLKPRWLTAAMKAGKKLDDFRIPGTAPAKPVARKGRPKAK